MPKKTRPHKPRKPSLAAQIEALKREIEQLRQQLAAMPTITWTEPKEPYPTQPWPFPDYPTFPEPKESPWYPYVRD